MNKFIHFIFYFFITLQLIAVPARQRRFKVHMIDGSIQTIRFCGDENRSFYLTDDGYIVEPVSTDKKIYIKTNKRPFDLESTKKEVSTRIAGIGSIDRAPIKPIGSPKIPVILVNFNDLKMTIASTDEECNTYYNLYCNGTKDGELYTGAGSKGAVRDYFAQQSDSIFLPDFKIIGPVTLSQPMAYYGQNGSIKDVHFNEFCKEALTLAMEDKNIEWNEFDNDNDGAVDMVFFIYAGIGENEQGADPNTIWPKEVVNPTVVGNTTVSVMGCSSELLYNGGCHLVAGIGTMCHEMMHVLGMPDQYDTNTVAVGLGMSYWSLMDCGNFCNNGYMPCGLTAYERDFLQWRSLQELTESCTVTLRPLESGGIGYKIVNSANPNEFYILENRYMVGWDEALCKLGHGLLVVHVDYDETVWNANKLNTNYAHQRMSFIPANNLYIGQYNAQSASELKNALNGQPYPGNTFNVSLTDYTIPAATVFNGDFMHKPITQIREDKNGNITLKFMPKGQLAALNESSVFVDNLTTNGFTLSWNKVENAEAYHLSLSYLNDTEEITFLEIDSLKQPTYSIDNLPEATEIKCHIVALADKYEDAPEYTHIVTIPADQITDTTFEKEDQEGRVFSLDGKYLISGYYTECIHKLQPGIYIFQTDSGSKKILVKND